MIIQKPVPLNTELSSPRNIYTFFYTNVSFTGISLNYPDLLLYTNDTLILPYNEHFMSFNKKTYYEEHDMTFDFILSQINYKENNPVYFFVYNLENYYHFIYDTLPYLYQYFKLRESIPNLQLLINPKNKLYQFVKETFDLLEVNYTLLKPDVQYTQVYFGSSLTHQDLSNYPPNEEIFSIYKKLIDNALTLPIEHKELMYKNLYISRRSHLHNSSHNIGTDYTTRRKCIEEDQLVDYLQTKDFIEVFPETWTMTAKIQIFNSALNVIGCIGGGVCNLLFSPKTTQSLVIVSPYFLEINYRFRYSLDHTNIRYFDKCFVQHDDYPFAKFMRVFILSGEHKDKWAEIEDINNGIFTVVLGNKTSVSIPLNGERTTLYKDQVKLVDKGLNSPFHVDLDMLKEYINS